MEAGVCQSQRSATPFHHLLRDQKTKATGMIRVAVFCDIVFIPCQRGTWPGFSVAKLYMQALAQPLKRKN